MSSSGKTPVYFLSIGGPNSLVNTDHPSNERFAAVGQEITSKVRPNAIIVISAHWQADNDTLQINVGEHESIIYDFYGFPPYYYDYTFPNRGSPELADRVIKKLNAASIKVERVKRGLDHGVWVGFRAAFDQQANPLNIPIVQLSLFAHEDPDKHYRVGQALDSLRDEGVLIIGAGMAVHNTKDFKKVMNTNKTMPYASVFEDALKDATTSSPEERQAAMAALFSRDDIRDAHPTAEHLLPIFVAAGAAGSDKGERLWTYPDGSLNWAQYRFGHITP